MSSPHKFEDLAIAGAAGGRRAGVADDRDVPADRGSTRPVRREAIRVAAENAVLGRFMESIRALGVASRRRTGARRAVQEQRVKDHRAIVAALRGRDPEAASAAMHRHIENVERA